MVVPITRGHYLMRGILKTCTLRELAAGRRSGLGLVQRVRGGRAGEFVAVVFAQIGGTTRRRVRAMHRVHVRSPFIESTLSAWDGRIASITLTSI